METEKQEKKSLFRALKRMWDREGERQQEKKKQKEARPPGIRARKWGKGLFWVAFSCLAVLSLVGYVQAQSAVTQKPVAQTTQQNHAVSPEAVTYGRDFLQAYYTFENTDEGLAAHKAALAPFLSKGLDEQGGIDIGSIQGSSRVRSITVKQTEAKGQQKAFLTYLVEGTITRTWTEEKEVEVKQGDKKVKKKEKQTKNEDKAFTQTIQVPVAYQSGHFSVYDLPKFVAYKQEATADKAKIPNHYEAYHGSTAKVEAFLETFFKSYAEDDADKLSYLVAPTLSIQGLGGAMVYQEMQDQEIRVGKKGQLLIWVTVTFKQPDTGLKMNGRYQMTIQKGKQEKRYLVQEWNEH
ncbi:conjugal transfer protein [Listeria valentina]|uniref:conjugal transfer protein n=1 Tax=Listeria valentina TaxID=2705293 RepID=UPI0014322E83|nr:conjugal transfer protein [Listeria valentina]